MLISFLEEEILWIFEFLWKIILLSRENIINNISIMLYIMHSA